MRGLAIAIAIAVVSGLGLASGCARGGVDEDGSDAGHPSFDQPIGAACDPAESALCARGGGMCHDRVCSAFCNAAQTPSCPGGTIEVHPSGGDRDICVCGVE